MLGSHLSIAGGVHNALLEADKLGCDCVQVFTANQRQWSPRPPDARQIELWHHHRAELGLEMIISHDSYLINLASPDPAAHQRSVDALARELERCHLLDIPYLVIHPGSHVGSGEAAGLERIIAALDALHERLPHVRTVTCLEVTAGQGTSLGHRLEHLRQIRDAASAPHRLAYCLDTAHLLAAGHDLGSAAATRRVLREVDRTLGLDLVKVIHINDSKTPLASRVDRHEHIGHGHIPLESFAVLMNHRRLQKVPKILETPKEDAPDGRPWDAINLKTLRDLRKRRRPAAPAAAPQPARGGKKPSRQAKKS